jgi:hypothetical protein
MRAKRFVKVLVMFVVIAPIAVFVMGEIVLHLWNWLTPALFGWKTITFWQAVGLLVLCRILFGRFGGRSHGRSQIRHRMRERWEQMSPEQRDRMREKWQRFGFRPPEAEAKP